MVDVVQRALTATVRGAQKVRGHIADDDLTVPTVASYGCDAFLRHRREAHPLRDHVPRLAHPELLEAPRGSLRCHHVGDDVRPVQKVHFTRRVPRVVDIRDDGPAKVRDLLVVGCEESRVAARPRAEYDAVPGRAARAERSVLEPARHPLVGQHKEISVEPGQAGEQLGVARVVVMLEPDAREEKPVGGRRRAGEQPAQRDPLHGGSV